MNHLVHYLRASGRCLQVHIKVYCKAWQRMLLQVLIAMASLHRQNRQLRTSIGTKPYRSSRFRPSLLPYSLCNPSWRTTG